MSTLRLAPDHGSATLPTEALDEQPGLDCAIPFDPQPFALQRGTQLLPDRNALRVVARQMPERDVEAAPLKRVFLILLGVEAMAGVVRFLAASLCNRPRLPPTRPTA